jgi:hypothetical protein
MRAQLEVRCLVLKRKLKKVPLVALAGHINNLVIGRYSFYDVFVEEYLTRRRGRTMLCTVIIPNHTPATNNPFYINDLASTCASTSAAAQEFAEILRDFESHAFSAAAMRFASSASE